MLKYPSGGQGGGGGTVCISRISTFLVDVMKQGNDVLHYKVR